eukprot:CAMPEP_0119122818 /NCGR_PEP_ID=MMETSP1310-20130426/2966_1 /TAXON_ID=464262 /ORGANISM="Genus nov. species nov., Strain RCC2339" /LENGTH=249 /DNA_ID=CAMNT_0007112533 /DNA_START=234 /DNA_END=980 /DNA_ORIENTATION=-
MTIVFSHGNATDLGLIHGELRRLSRKLQVNVLAYDYEGYGPNLDEAKPTESGCMEDIERVVEYALTEFRTKEGKRVTPRHLILYGRSVGSGPTCYMAHRLFKDRESRGSKTSSLSSAFCPSGAALCSADSNEDDSGWNEKAEEGEGCPPVAGIVLVSPFQSCLHVVSDVLPHIYPNTFPNYKRLPAVHAPIYICHGDQDNVVPYNNGKELSKVVPNLWRFRTLEGRGHNDIHLDLIISDLQEFFAGIHN